MDFLSSPIVPSIGRIVLVRGPDVLPGDPTREVPAIVTRVWGDNCINLRAFRDDGDGGDRSYTSVTYRSNLDPQAVTIGVVWSWMAYQVAAAEASKVGA